MARRREAQKRQVLPDPKYKEELVTRFVNCMMKDGKKSAAEKAFYGAMDIIATEGVDPIELLKKRLKMQNHY